MYALKTGIIGEFSKEDRYWHTVRIPFDLVE
jgi:hypothetical protein